MARKTKKADAVAREIVQEILDAEASTNVQVHLAGGPKGEHLPHFQRLRMSKELAKDFFDIVEDHLSEFELEKLDVCAHYAEPRPSEHELEYINLSHAAHTFIYQQIKDLISDKIMQDFAADDDFIKNLRFYAISIPEGDGPAFHCFRLFTQARELARSARFAAIGSKATYNRIRQKVFLFDTKIDCIYSREHLFIRNKQSFQQMFRYFEFLKKQAKKALRLIKQRVPVTHKAALERECKTQAHLLKLQSIVAGKHLEKKIDFERYRQAITQFGLDIKIINKNGREMLDYVRSNTWELLRLLDDDYLISHVTDGGYEAFIKKPHKILYPPGQPPRT